MSRRKKISIEERVKIIRKYISGGIGITEAGRICGVNRATVADWCRNYEAEGVEAFLPHHKPFATDEDDDSEDNNNTPTPQKKE